MTYQTVEGFGANINHRSWDINALPPVLNALIDDAGMSLFRIILDRPLCELTNDNSDALLMDWDSYHAQYSAPAFQKLWGLTAYLNEKGITNGAMLNFQGRGPDWMVDANNWLLPGAEAEWAEMFASLYSYARNTQHLQFSLVAPFNETDVFTAIRMTSQQSLTALHRLAELLDTNGLSDIRFVAPDLCYTNMGVVSAMMNDAVIMGKLGHFGIHAYESVAGGTQGIYDFLQRSAYPDRTFWVSEYSLWCATCENGTGGIDDWNYARGTARYLLSHLADGASAALVWEGYDSQYNYYTPNQWSYWGLFAVNDTNALIKTYHPRKSFHAMAQLTRFIQPGAVRIDSGAWAGPLWPVAFYHPDNGQITVAGVNAEASPQQLSIALTNLPPMGSFELYYTGNTTNLCHSATIPVAGGSISVSIPANSVYVLASRDPFRAGVSVQMTAPVDGAYFAAPVDIALAASASTVTGAISQVSFYWGSTNIGDAVTEPYGILWSNVPPGDHVLSVRATNAAGFYGISPSIRVTVAGPIARIVLNPTNAVVAPYGTQQFTAVARDALGTTLVPQPTFSWAAGGGAISTNGFFTAGLTLGTFTVTAASGDVVGATSIAIGTNVNLAPAGTGYTWYNLTAATGTTPRAVAPGINDGNTVIDVMLDPDGPEHSLNLFEAAGIVWPAPQAVSRVVFRSGSYTAVHDGVFGADFGLQLSLDGNTWSAAGPQWTLTPAYAYDSPDAAHTSFTFTGTTAIVRGVRCGGRVHTSDLHESSWLAFATEVQAFPGLLPLLSANATPEGIAISWPASLPTYHLEGATNLLSFDSWRTITNAPQVSGEMQKVMLPMSSELSFFRLRSP